MQGVAVVSGLVELVLSFVLGVLVAFVSFKVFARLTRSLDEVGEMKRNNVAVGVLMASTLVSCALVVRQTLYPVVSSVQTALFNGIDLLGAAKVVGLSVLYLCLSLAIAILAVNAATRVFLRLTRELDELAEIKQNNVAVALTLGAVIVVMGLFLAHGVESLLAALIPFPAMESIQILGQP